MLEYGFFQYPYKSVNGVYETEERIYDSESFNNLLSMVIKDGVFEYVGDKFQVIQNVSNVPSVLVKTGRVWFHNHWIYNESPIIYTFDHGDPRLPRMDGLFFYVDMDKRVAGITKAKGIPAKEPKPPILENTETMFYQPFVYITIPAKAYSIQQGHIKNLPGTNEYPYANSIFDITSIADIFDPWTSEFDEWFENLTSALDDETKEEILERFQTLVNLINHEKNDKIECVGDVKYTVRTDLGDNWVLCNGEALDDQIRENPGEYSEIENILPMITNNKLNNNGIVEFNHPTTSSYINRTFNYIKVVSEAIVFNGKIFFITNAFTNGYYGQYFFLHSYDPKTKKVETKEIILFHVYSMMGTYALGSTLKIKEHRIINNQPVIVVGTCNSGDSGGEQPVAIFTYSDLIDLHIIYKNYTETSTTTLTYNGQNPGLVVYCNGYYVGLGYRIYINGGYGTRIYISNSLQTLDQYYKDLNFSADEVSSNFFNCAQIAAGELSCCIAHDNTEKNTAFLYFFKVESMYNNITNDYTLIEGIDYDRHNITNTSAIFSNSTTTSVMDYLKRGYNQSVIGDMQFLLSFPVTVAISPGNHIYSVIISNNSEYYSSACFSRINEKRNERYAVYGDFYYDDASTYMENLKWLKRSHILADYSEFTNEIACAVNPENGHVFFITLKVDRSSNGVFINNGRSDLLVLESSGAKTYSVPTISLNGAYAYMKIKEEDN